MINIYNLTASFFHSNRANHHATNFVHAYIRMYAELKKNWHKKATAHLYTKVCAYDTFKLLPEDYFYKLNLPCTRLNLVKF